MKFLRTSHSAVRSHLAAAMDLPTFLATAGALSLGGRKRIVEQALLLFDHNFVHLPLKESMYGVNPLQKLKLIQHRLDQASSGTMEASSRSIVI